MRNAWISRPDTTVPEADKQYMRGARNGATHTLCEIGQILYYRGKEDHILSEAEVSKILKKALKKVRCRLIHASLH